MKRIRRRAPGPRPEPERLPAQDHVHHSADPGADPKRGHGLPAPARPAPRNRPNSPARIKRGR